jgi:hypothetical protein
MSKLFVTWTLAEIKRMKEDSERLMAILDAAKDRAMKSPRATLWRTLCAWKRGNQTVHNQTVTFFATEKETIRRIVARFDARYDDLPHIHRQLVDLLKKDGLGPDWVGTG